MLSFCGGSVAVAQAIEGIMLQAAKLVYALIL